MTRRDYENDEIRVSWDSTRCIHVGRCIRALGTVFDPLRRPWIDMTGADADSIAHAVEQCPSGALTYERLDGADNEALPDIPVIVPRANGPLMITGTVRVETARGDLFEEAGRLTLCRCGASRNQPFCDNSHREIRFSDNPVVITADRQAAIDPTEVSDTVQPEP